MTVPPLSYHESSKGSSWTASARTDADLEVRVHIVDIKADDDGPVNLRAILTYETGQLRSAMTYRGRDELEALRALATWALAQWDAVS